ncbi:uncharacterized protein LOC101864606 [Aplysia californica]|uniref:Uncharacterized protein LOC101864606 n=1 Tax=Aplysia californica TaxID=6500 RepID=A0ABM1VR34_APLCA|nr:uncharacterized protein LOC101864606 [Aplysia californica]
MSEADKAVLSLCEEFWQWRLKESPELASFSGFHQYDDQWDDISEEAYTRRDNCVQEFVKKAKALNVTECSPEVALSHTLLCDVLDLYTTGSQFKSHLCPINYLEGIHKESNLTISYMKFLSEEDFDKYISRLEKLPSRIQQVTALLKRGVEDGVVMYKCSVAEIPNQIEAALNTELDKLGLLEPLSKEHKDIPAESISKYSVRAKDIVMSEVFPALTELRDYVKETYMKKTRPCAGINTLKNGSAWYQACLNHHLSCMMTPQEVHEIGLKEVQRIRGEILKLAAKEELGGTFPAILQAIVKKQENNFQTKEDILNYVKNLCHERIRPKLSTLFKNIPDLPLSIVPFPDYMKGGPAGYYLSGTPDGSRDGGYYINIHNPKDCHQFHLPALSLHEGEPGHHLQSTNALAATHLPDFRRYCEDSKYYLSPRNFPFYTAYIEGWGLYSEALGEEMGIYEDSFEWLGRYSFEIFRAARLVVDTGLHAFGWSKEKAVKYMIDNSLEPESDLRQEVERYITWPGQACAYKIGEIKIWELRRKAEKELGDKFDIREFHDRILSSGPMSIPMLASIVDSFIKENKGEPTPMIEEPSNETPSSETPSNETPSNEAEAPMIETPTNETEKN